MRYFITGATGFVGGRVARMLREAGHEVAALVRSPEKAGDLEAIGVEIHKGDILEKETMRAPMQGADGIFHIAGWYGYRKSDREKGRRINVDGTRNVLEMMQEQGIPKGVYTSALAVNSCTGGDVVNEEYEFTGEHLSAYDEAKAAAHDIADEMIEKGLPLVILMPGAIYGPGDTSTVRDVWLNLLQRKMPGYEPSMLSTWVYIDDIAEAHIAAMEKGAPGETYITCGEIHTTEDVFETFHQITGIRPPMKLPVFMQLGMAGVIGVAEQFFDPPRMYASEWIKITSGRCYIADASKAKRELGFNPRPLREGLEITLAHEMKLLGMATTQEGN